MKFLLFKYQIKDMITAGGLYPIKPLERKHKFITGPENQQKVRLCFFMTGPDCKIAGASDPLFRDEAQCDA